MSDVRLTDLIAPQFYAVHDDIKRHGHTHYKLYGGRGSTKSSFISIEIIMGMMQDPEANAAVFRQVGNTLRESVYEQLLWAIDALQVSHLWRAQVQPLQLIYQTGQRILFRGNDDPNKTKSIKLRKGYFKYIWYEERAEFAGDEDERKINQSLMRGGSDFVVFYSWNPPKSLDSWVNQDVLVPRSDTLCHHSTYLTVPREWLGDQFWTEADELRKRKPIAYRHEYLGEAVGTGGKVFDNVTLREITDEEINTKFDHIRQGLDFGFAIDPLAFVRLHYSRKHKRIYIFDEVYGVNLKTPKACSEIRRCNPENAVIIADSEEPRSIDAFNDQGLRLVPVKKGPGSVDFGMRFLADDLDEIIIDPARCPNAAREFSSYELERDRHGNFKGGYPDKNNHMIDATRYALNNDMTRRKARIRNRAQVTGV